MSLTLFLALSLFSPLYVSADSASQALALQTRIENRINGRISELNQVIANTAWKKFPDADKNAIVTTAKENIASLMDLRNKVAGTTDLAALQGYLLQMKDSIPHAKILMSKTRIPARAELMDIAADQLIDTANDFDAKVAAAQAAGKDVSRITPLLSEMHARLGDATVQYDNAKTIMAALSVPALGMPNDTAYAIATIQKVQSAVAVGQADLGAARTLRKSITDALKAIGA